MSSMMQDVADTRTTTTTSRTLLAVTQRIVCPRQTGPTGIKSAQALLQFTTGGSSPLVSVHVSLVVFSEVLEATFGQRVRGFVAGDWVAVMVEPDPTALRLHSAP